MSHITALSALPKREDRFHLEVDGQPVAVVDAELVHSAKLAVGGEYDVKTSTRVETGAARLAAFDKAMEALGRRMRSARELEHWLVQRGHAQVHVAPVIQKLTRLGLLNDVEYARAFARSRAVGRGLSRRRIQAELARRGLPREVIDAAIAEVLADEGIDEAAIVEAAAKKKLATLSKLAPDVRRRRLYAFLARRGYPGDHVRDVVRRLCAKGAEAPDESLDEGAVGNNARKRSPVVPDSQPA